MKAVDINRIIGIEESYQLPDVLLGLLLDDPKPVFRAFMELGESLEHDWFTEYFEEEHANKSKMAQDFTPSEVCDLLAHVVGRADSVADVCAGTGGLTIGMWRHNPTAKYICYEYSSRAIPLLLFNLAIRNIDGMVCRCDLLTGGEYEYYRIEPAEEFSSVTRMEEWPQEKVAAVVSNPPYSMKYDPKADRRFPEYEGMLPPNFADFVFVAFALSVMKDGGKAGFILPHGVLFRGNKEAIFRQMLIRKGILRSVIGLPDKLFINTDIPTCVLQLQAGRSREGILFIDAKDEAEKCGSKNIMRSEHLDRISRAFDRRAEEERFAHVASPEEVEANDFNCNIPRYVDTFVPEPLPDIGQLTEELFEINKSIRRTEIELAKQLDQLVAGNAEDERAVRKYVAYLRSEGVEKHDQLQFDLSAID